MRTEEIQEEINITRELHRRHTLHHGMVNSTIMSAADIVVTYDGKSGSVIKSRDMSVSEQQDLHQFEDFIKLIDNLKKNGGSVIVVHHCGL